MDPQKMKEAYQRLEALDDRLSYKVRPKKHSMVQPSPDQINSHLTDVAEFTLELKEILRDMMLAFASKPKASQGSQGPPQGPPKGPPGGTPGSTPPGGLPTTG